LQYNHGGKTREYLEKSGISREDLLDLSANINPLGPPEWLRTVINRNIEYLIHYPDIDAFPLVKVLADLLNLDPQQLVIGNGASELIYTIPRAVKADTTVVLSPSYSDYEYSATVAGSKVKHLFLEEEAGFIPDFSKLDDFLSRTSGAKLVFLGQPNNPTGVIFEKEPFLDMARRHADTIFCVDEAFADFIEEYDSLIHENSPNLVIVRSFTKFYAIPGLRLGWAFGNYEIINRIKELLPTWSVNTISLAVGEEALKDTEYAEKTRNYVKKEREFLSSELSKIEEFTVYPSAANYLMVKMEIKGSSVREMADYLLRKGIAVRECSNYRGLDERFFRIAVRTREENERFLETIDEFLESRRTSSKYSRASLITPTKKKGRRTPAIMVQGTSSNAGKSVLVAALCRILLQEGYRVAPFKAQNMALNSFVTSDGGEMGRAQVVQAQACKIEPDVRMNPVLLKPSSETGSQVIVRGKPLKNMEALEYYKYKKELIKTVERCYDELSCEYDVIVLEGAGSPAEVNLKSHDMVNMRMAGYAKSPVLIVGDIDRGGVFASFVGTMEVLSEWERKLVAGFVVNKFRGDKTLLDPALDYLVRRTGREVFGIIPYITRLGLPEEDSVSFKEESYSKKHTGASIKIGLIDLPHISNFNDLDPFKIEPDIELKIIRSEKDLDFDVDAVILPGSKNVIGDLKHLRKVGLEGRIIDQAREGKTVVVGICGGFQMLGRSIADPGRLESSDTKAEGMGLLSMDTILGSEKVLKRVRARHTITGINLTGYEIHHGRTKTEGGSPIIKDESENIIGITAEELPVWGTYLHGIFDSDSFRRWFIDNLRERKGLTPLNKTTSYDLEPAFDRLADIVRENCRIKNIIKLAGL